MEKTKVCASPSSSNCKQGSLFASSVSEDELHVTQILLDLPHLFMEADSRSKFHWGCKRRRSFLDGAPSFSCEPSPSFQKIDEEIEGRGRNRAVKAEDDGSPVCASSPATPLAFVPSESDEKLKHYPNKTSKKRSRKEYNDVIEGLTESRDLFRREREKMRKHHKNNSELKAKKQEILSTFLRKEEEPQMEGSRFMNLGMVVAQQPSISDPTAHKFQISIGPINQNASDNGNGSVSLVGPSRIPDLNLLAEEAFGVDSFQPLDVSAQLVDKRARFAEARRIRREMIMNKYIGRISGAKLPNMGSFIP